MTKKLIAKNKLFKRLRGKLVKNKLSLFGQRLLAKQLLRFFYGNLIESQFKTCLQKSKRFAKSSQKVQKFSLNSKLSILLKNFQVSSNKSSVTFGFISLLERRLDIILYRSKFVKSIFEARQVINHGHILVNGSKVKAPGYILSISDVVQVDKNSWSFFSKNIFNGIPRHFLVENPFEKTSLQDIQEKNKNTKILTSSTQYNLTTKDSKIKLWHPTYMVVNYRILSLVLIALPSIEHLFGDIMSDLNLVIEYYNRI